MELIDFPQQIPTNEVMSEPQSKYGWRRVQHINAILRAIRAVNQLITRENDQEALLNGLCNCLIKIPDYYSVWIVLMDKDNHLTASAEAGLGKDFMLLVEQMQFGNLPDCLLKSIDNPDIVVIDNPSLTCTTCPLASVYFDKATITTQLEHGGKIYGFISVSILKDLELDMEEQILFKEVATDVAFALYSMEIEAEHKKTEQEKKQLAAQLQYMQRMEAIGTLAGGIAHHFNNLLMGIQGNASLMMLDIDPSSQPYKRLNNIEKSVRIGAKLTSQLLGYAREGKYEVKPFSLNHLIQKTSKAFGMAKREIIIHQDLSGKFPAITADQRQIEQVLLNLFVNAADAMPTGGKLFLKTSCITDKDMTGKPYRIKPGNYILLTVQDTGRGMEKKTLERIFEPFFTTKGFGRGAGLGLASSYGIIKSHAGYIDVESEVGQGTAFSIYLPVFENVIPLPSAPGKK